jgi:hypothetical protein
LPRASAWCRISNFIAGLAIFPHYSLDLEVLYGSVDGQKFEAADQGAVLAQIPQSRGLGFVRRVS